MLVRCVRFSTVVAEAQQATGASAVAEVRGKRSVELNEIRGIRMSPKITIAFSSLAFAVAAVVSTPAGAEILKFHANLDGRYGSEPTGSSATGHADIKVDTVTRRMSVDLKVHGITIDQLWAKLVAKPIGPIHFHEYNMPNGGAMLALPLPYGPSYRPTTGGLHVKMKNFDYAADAALVDAHLSFDDFLAGIRNGVIILNVHTNKFNPGEISGLVVPD